MFDFIIGFLALVQINVERKGRPFKAFVLPTEKMQGVSTYEQDFPVHENAERAKAVIPQSEQKPLEGRFEGESVTHSQFTPKPVSQSRAVTEQTCARGAFAVG